MYLDSMPGAGHTAVVHGDEAKHAVRVKRIQPGDTVQILDGAGTVAEAVVLDRAVLPDALAARREKRGEWLLPVRIQQVTTVEPVRPAIHVLSATPKGARLEEMIDALSQAGASSWAPLMTDRGVVDPRDTKLARMERVAVEASKQCGRAWVLRTRPRQPFADALVSSDGPVILADASGEPYRATVAPEIRLLIGPEGGWTGQELTAARGAGARICSFGPHAMRIETAAVVACGALLAIEAAAPPAR